MKIQFGPITSRRDLSSAVGRLPRSLVGRVPDPTGAVKRILRKGGDKAVELIRHAYLVKAGGGRDAAGLKWAPLKPSTLAAKKRAGAPRDILINSRSLLGSIGVGDKSVVSLSALPSRPNAITLGTDVPYAEFHHNGTIHMPARPLWPDPSRWPPQWWRQIGDAMARQLMLELQAGNKRRK